MSDDSPIRDNTGSYHPPPTTNSGYASNVSVSPGDTSRLPGTNASAVPPSTRYTTPHPYIGPAANYSGFSSSSALASTGYTTTINPYISPAANYAGSSSSAAVANQSYSGNLHLKPIVNNKNESQFHFLATERSRGERHLITVQLPAPDHVTLLNEIAVFKYPVRNDDGTWSYRSAANPRFTSPGQPRTSLWHGPFQALHWSADGTYESDEAVNQVVKNLDDGSGQFPTFSLATELVQLSRPSVMERDRALNDRRTASRYIQIQSVKVDSSAPGRAGQRPCWKLSLNQAEPDQLTPIFVRVDLSKGGSSRTPEAECVQVKYHHAQDFYYAKAVAGSGANTDSQHQQVSEIDGNEIYELSGESMTFELDGRNIAAPQLPSRRSRQHGTPRPDSWALGPGSSRR